MVAFACLEAGCGDFFPSGSSVDSLDLSPSSYFMVVGEAKQLTATATTVAGDTVDTSNTATWNSSSTSVASVDAQGVVTALSKGSGTASTTIKAKKDGVSASTYVTIAASPLTALSVAPSSADMKVGTKKQLGASGKFLDNSSFTVTDYVDWRSSDTSVARVSSSGEVIAIAAGTVTITATATTSLGTVTNTATITVPSS